MEELTGEILEQCLDYITNPHTETIPYHFHIVEGILKEVWEIDSKMDYENYKKTIKFFYKNFPSIVSGLQSNNISIKKQCAEFLGYIYDYRSVDPLITSLKHPDSGFRSICIKSLIKIKKCSIEPLIESLKNPDKNVRRSAIRALNKMPNEKYFDLYIQLLEDKDAFVRYYAINLLIRIIPPNAIDSISKLIKDKSPLVRTKVAWSAWYLYRLNEIYNIEKNLDIIEFIRCYELIIDTILNALNDEKRSVRKKMIDVLIKFDFDITSYFYDHLDRLLKEIKIEQDHVDNLDDDIFEFRIRIEPENFRSNMITGKFKHILDVWILRDHLLNSIKNKLTIADISLKFIKKYNNDLLLVNIKNAINDEDPKIRELAIRLLARLAKYDITPILIESFNDEDPNVRKAAIQKIGHNNAKNSVQFIKTALNDDSKLVREEAESILYLRGELKNYKQEVYLREDASPEERSFYDQLLSNLCKKNPVDFEDNKNYIYMFLYETVRKFSENKDIKDLITNFELIENSYSNYDLLQDLNHWKSGAYFLIDEFEKSFYYKKKAGLEYYEDLFIFAMLLGPSKKSLINGEIILNLSDENILTDFGKNHKDEIILVIDGILNENYAKHNKHLISHFIHDHIFYSSQKDPNYENKYGDYFCVSLKDKDLNALSKYFDNKYEFDELKFHYSRYQKGIESRNHFSNEEYFDFIPFPDILSKKYLNDDSNMEFIVPNIILKAFLNYVKKLVRKAENRVRKDHNLPEVGKNWNEMLLFNKIKQLFPNEIIIQHGRPSWLGLQHLDIFFPKRNIGIEYQGEQHQKPIPQFGGEKGFKKQKERDKRKKRLCKENNCKLIYVYPGYEIQDVNNQIINAMNSL
jgi:HEAT repeat protein